MYRIRTTWTGPQGAPYLSTMYFAAGGGTAAQAAAAVGTFWGAVDNYVDNLWVWKVDDDVALIDSTNGDITGLSSVVGATGAGTGAGDPMPRVAQGLIRWRTGSYFGGREVRGRTFVPGITTTTPTGSVSSTVQAGINTAAANLIADANSLLIIWSRTHFLEEVVASGTCWSEFAALRSRRD